MKSRWKRIGSLLLALCMVMTLLLPAAFAEDGTQDFGVQITAFADLDADVAEQTVEAGTEESELNLPGILTVTVTVTTGTAITADVSGDEIATDSDAQEPQEQEEEIETTVAVSGWTSDPDYDGDTEGVYIFTPALDLPDGLTVAERVTPPQITVTVNAPAAPAASARRGSFGITATTNHTWSGTGDFNTDTLQPGDTITLSGNVTGSLTVPDTVASLTIDGGSNTLTGQIFASADLNLTLKNITVTYSAAYQPAIGSVASLTLAAEENVAVSGGCGIKVVGDLAITGGSSIITGTTGTGAEIDGNLTISGSAAPTFTGANYGATCGDLTISDSAAPTFIGTSNAGLMLVGDATISTSGTTQFTSNATDNWAGLHFYSEGKTLTLNGSGAVNVTGASQGIRSDGSLTIAGTGSGALNVLVTGNGYGITTNFSGKTLTLSKTNGGINVTTTTGGQTIRSNFSNVNINGVTVTLTPGGAGSAIGGNAHITDGALTANGNLGGNLIVSGAVNMGGTATIESGKTLTVNAGATLTIPSGTTLTNNGTLVNNGAITVDSGGTLTQNGAVTTAGSVTNNGTVNGTNASDLTGGGAVTGTMDVGGTTVSDLTQSANGTGWSWNASTATLTLGSSYTHEPIAVNCQDTDTVNLVCTGDVSLTSSAASTIYCKGNLNITGSGGTLTLNSASSDSLYCAIEVNGALIIGGNADVNAACAGSGINPAAVVIYGKQGVTVSGSANVTATATGTDASGIWVEFGDITISTSGTVTANGNGTGGALGIYGSNTLDMTSGNLVLTGRPLHGDYVTAPAISGGNITIDDTQVYLVKTTLSGISTITAVTSISSPASAYGVFSDYTNTSGELYFLLPAGNQTVTLTAGGNRYTGTVNVTTDNAATATLTTGGGSVTGTMEIGGTTISDLTQSDNGTGWNWNASTATLTLNSSYGGNDKINIQCASSDHINLVLTGNVTIAATDWWGINVSGGLTIQAGSHTLAVSATTYDAIQASGGITIESGTVIATGGGNGLTTGSGSIVITGSANVTATGFTDPSGPIWSFNGIQSINGNVIISTSRVVNATGGKGGISAGGVTIESGTVNANGGGFALGSANNGVSITGGTVTTNTTGTANGDVYGNLTVSGASANVTINGSITNGGGLTVSGGAVTVTGIVSGTTNHTGGTLNGVTTGGENGGGNSGSTSTSPPVTPATGSGDTLSISGNDLGKQTTSEEGKTVETFTLKEDVQEQIAQAREEGRSSIEINIDSSRDATAVVNVSAALLSGMGEMNLSISTPHATLELPAALVQALTAAGQGLSISVERGNAAAVATEMAGVDRAEGCQVLGTPAVINTPLQGQTTVTLPLSGISLPAEAGARAEFLASLAVFVIHSDGEKTIVNGTISYDAQGNPASIGFETDRFSTFAIIKTVQKKEIILGIGKLDATVNGKVHTLDAAPFIKAEAGRTLVPVRFVSEMLGAEVQWLAESRQVVITEPGRKLVLTIGSDLAQVNGAEKTLDCPAEIVQGRTFVPLRFIGESLGTLVSWDEPNKSITVRR